MNFKLETKSDLEEITNQYDAVFLGMGANVSSKMKIEGEELTGVYGGNELLETKNHPAYIGKKVAVIGGGNVAMDTARTIQKLGAKEVMVIYRRAREQMPAERKEIEEAMEEGIQFLYQTNILKILGKSQVEKIECIQTKLVQKEGETRAVPVNIVDSNYIIDIDYVVMAVGSGPERKVIENLGLETTQYGYLQINEQYQTTNEKVFAGGDLAGSKATVAWASRAGRQAAEAMAEYLK